jgi:hypothetical protein
VKSLFRDRTILVILILGALTLRAATTWVLRDNLTDDRDAYLAIAQNLADGNGFSSPNSTSPTAFRPPLYPLVVSPLLKLPEISLGIALLQLALGASSVMLTFAAGLRLGLGRAATAAAALVAVDPLLVFYSTLPMTETLFSFLVILMIFQAAGSPSSEPNRTGAHNQTTSLPPDKQKARGPWRQLLLGVTFGLCALCRPAIWAYGLLLACWWIGRAVRGSGRRRGHATVPWMVMLGVAVCVSPWLIRNIVVFGQPVLTTTHGGYTLLLGNNPVFYRDVVAQPWGTVWDEASLTAWQKSIQAELNAELPGANSETDRDRWMYRRALNHIHEQPEMFARACCLRFCRFWNIVPLGPAGELVPRWANWLVGLFYAAVTLGLLLGLFRTLLHTDPSGEHRWMPVVLLLLSLSAVHLFYWSNARMRAGIIPAVALLAVHGCRLRTRCGDRADSGPEASSE